MKSKVAIIGFGIVGSGVAKILLEQKDSIQKRTGIEFEVTDIVDKDLSRDRGVSIPEGILHDDLDKVLNNPEIETVAVLVGGTTFSADIQKKILASGKNVVTANKALLAERGDEIFTAARDSKKTVAFEASCCGGIPLISSINTGLAANNITSMLGILNGTCNYILSSMTEQGKDYATALKEAQAAGFAEADPTLDVNGADSAHKIAILAMLAYGCNVNYDDITFSGIESVDLQDIIYGQKMGYTMKLLAIADKTDSGCISIQVKMAFISEDEPLARVSGPFNAVSIFGDAVGHTLYLGRGAGMMPTASAVVADIIDVARGNSSNIFKTTAGLGIDAEPAQLCPAEERVSRFYLRINAADRPGVMSQLTEILGRHQISIQSMLQQEVHGSHDFVPVIIMTDKAKQGNMDKATGEISALDSISDTPVCIPVVTPPTDE